MFDSRYDPGDGTCTLMNSIMICEEPEKSLDDIVGSHNVKVSGTKAEKIAAKRMFVVVTLHIKLSTL